MKQIPWIIRHARGVTLLCTLAVVAFIFSNSMQPAAQSSEVSGGLLETVNRLLSLIGMSMSEHLLRKLAHLTEFALLGVCLILTTRAYTDHVLQHITTPLFAGLAVPVLDETIQMFSVGRSAEVKDVLIDFSGVLIGMALTLALLWVISARKKRRA